MNGRTASRRSAVAVALVALALAGCSGDDSEGAVSTSTSSTEGTTTIEATTTTEAATPPSDGELSGFAECTDPPGDGSGGDLLAARLATQGPVLTIAYDTAAPLSGPSFSYYINIFSAGYQIGLRSIDGEVTRFVFDTAATQQENLTSAYTLDGTLATLAVPLLSLPNLEQPFDYTAVITVDGQDADECAGTFGDG